MLNLKIKLNYSTI